MSSAPQANRGPVGSHFAHKARLDLDLASTGLSISFFGQFRRLAAAADLIHYHFPWPLMDMAHFVCRIRKPSIVTYHSDIVRQKRLMTLYRPLMHAFLSRMDRIVVTSPDYLKTSAVLGRYRGQTVVIPIGLDANKPHSPEPLTMAKWRERLGPRFFLFVGALRYYKGLPYLVEAARRTGYSVAIAGTGTATTVETLSRAGMANLHLLGEVTDADKAVLLNMCAGFVFPSHLRSEAFGVALLEAAFAGKPLISCDIGTGASYVNQHGVTGLVVPPADPGALAEAMTAILQDPGQAARFGAAARERAMRLFSANQMSESYCALYDQVLAKPRRSA